MHFLALCPFIPHVGIFILFIASICLGGSSLTAAFDTVDHNILVARLQHLVGLCGSALEQWHSPVGDAAYLSESDFMQYYVFLHAAR